LDITSHQEPVFGSERFIIDSVAPDSPLAKEGVAAGALVEYDRYFEHIGTRHPDETIGLTVFQGTSVRHLSVKTIAQEIESKNGLAILNLIVASAAACMGLVIGFQQADKPAMRALSIFFLSYMFNQHVASPGSSWLFTRYGWALTIWPLMAGLTVFSILYQIEYASARRLALARLVPGYLAVTVLATWGYVWSYSHYLPAQQGINIACGSMNTAIVLFALWDAWRHSSGEWRQRQLWLLVLFGFRSSVIIISFLQPNFPAALQAMPWIQREAALLVIAGLAYAIFRLKVLNVGFAVNRALAYTVFSTLLLLVFSITEWGVDKLLHFQGREKNVIFDAVVALGIILSFHRIQHWVNHHIDHIFFHRWYEKAEKLRAFLDKATHILDAPALQAKFIRAIERYANASGAAIYTLDGAAGFILGHSTLGTAPALIDANDDAVIDLRHTHNAVEFTGLGSRSSTGLAFPMMVRGQLHGLLLLGPRDDGESYRPDQIALLTTSVHRFGIELESLRMEALERHASELQQKLLSSEEWSKVLEQKSALQEREAVALRRLHQGGVHAAQ
jgi:hypothetical protein